MKLLVAILSIVALPATGFASMGSALEGAPLLNGILLTIVYGAIGIAMALVAFRLVDAITPGNLSKEITEKQNLALAVLVSAFVLGICIIIAAAMIG